VRRFDRRDADISLTLEADDTLFPNVPDRRHHHLLDAAATEFLDELRHLGKVARRFPSGKGPPRLEGDLRYESPRYERGTLYLGNQQVMQEWERPIMAALADVAAGPSRSVLEVGFGLGICATLIQERGAAAHTIVESNPDLCEAAERWKQNYPGRQITIVSGRWQEVMGDLGLFDAIVLDPHPERDAEVAAISEGTYQIQMIDAGAEHVRTGGIVTYYSADIDSLSRADQRALLKRFSEIRISVVRGLKPPPDCVYWVADSMAVVVGMK
jgi:hypothetical protein